MSTSSTIAWFLNFVLGYVAAPVALVWGWIRCVQDRWQLLTSLLGALVVRVIARLCVGSLGPVGDLLRYAGGFGTLPELQVKEVWAVIGSELALTLVCRSAPRFSVHG